VVVVVEVGGLRGVGNIKIVGVVVVVVNVVVVVVVIVVVVVVDVVVVVVVVDVVVVDNVVVLIVVGIVGNVKSGRRLGARCVGNGWSKVAEGAWQVRWDKVASAVSRGEAAIVVRA